MNQYLIEMIKIGRNNAGLTQAQVAKLLGIKGNTLSGYETGASEPDIDTYLKLCKIYNLDYVSILEQAYDLKPIDEITLSNHEIAHIQKYRSLSHEDKETVEYLVDRLTIREAPRSYINLEAPKMIDLYPRLASAGTGQYLFDDIPAEKIEVDWNCEADFAIGVNGDSMEPTYHDEDTLLVKKQKEINIGEIGIFIVNGESYVKEYQKNKLVSHNKKYPDIEFSETMDISCIGKVIGIS